jgi:hypothetical protein
MTSGHSTRDGLRVFRDGWNCWSVARGSLGCLSFLPEDNAVVKVPDRRGIVARRDYMTCHQKVHNNVVPSRLTTGTVNLVPSPCVRWVTLVEASTEHPSPDNLHLLLDGFLQ